MRILRLNKLSIDCCHVHVHDFDVDLFGKLNPRDGFPFEPCKD